MTEQPGNGLELSHAAHMPAPQGGALPTGLEWQALERMAHMLADSNLIPYTLKKKPGDVAVILLAAREYGIPPLMALSKLPVVNGKPAPMGELMVALVLRAGHSIRADFKAPDGTRYKGGPLTPQHYGEAIVRRRDWPAGVEESLTFTLAEGIAAGLLTITREGRPVARDKNDKATPWEQYTPNMARWRAVANVCRLYFPDVLLGLSYLPEELGAVVDEDGMPVVGEVVDERPAPPSGTLEERTAQEAADRLAEFNGPVEVLDNVTAHAQANGYLEARVSYAGDSLTLRDAIAHKRAELDAIVDVEGTEEPATEAPAEQPVEQPAPAPSPAEEEPVDAELVDTPTEAASAPQEPEQPVAGARPAPVEETPQEAALDVAREVLKCGDAGVLLTYYNGAKGEGLLELDVLAVVDDGDLATLEAPEGLEVLPLGALIVQAGKYVKATGIAVRDPEPEVEQAFDSPTAPPVEGDDPWADGSATAGSAYPLA